MFTVTFQFLKTHFILYICTSINHPCNADYYSMLYYSVLYVLIGSSSIVRFQNPYLQDWQCSVHFFQIGARISTFRYKNSNSQESTIYRNDKYEETFCHIFILLKWLLWKICFARQILRRYGSEIFWEKYLEWNAKKHLSPGNALWCIPHIYTVIRFVSTSAKFGTSTIVGLSGALVENEMHTM